MDFLIKTYAYFYRNLIMSKRNFFTIFEIFFWPVVSLISIGLFALYVTATGDTGFVGPQNYVAFAITGTLALSIVHVCQLDISYSFLYSVWSKSLKHEMMSPTNFYHMISGAYLVGLIRAFLVSVILLAVGYSIFDFSFPVGKTIVFLFGLSLSAISIGQTVNSLVLLFGQNADVAAWSVVHIVMLLSGVYYPVNLLPQPLTLISYFIPITHFLGWYRESIGLTSFKVSIPFSFFLSIIWIICGFWILRICENRAKRKGNIMKLSE